MKYTDKNGMAWRLYGNKSKGLASAAKRRGVTQERGPGVWLVADNGEVRHARVEASAVPTRASIHKMGDKSFQNLLNGSTKVVGPVTSESPNKLKSKRLS